MVPCYIYHSHKLYIIYLELSVLRGYGVPIFSSKRHSIYLETGQANNLFFVNIRGRYDDIHLWKNIR